MGTCQVMDEYALHCYDAPIWSSTRERRPQRVEKRNPDAQTRCAHVQMQLVRAYALRGTCKDYE
jgi:hypothetical protein